MAFYRCSRSKKILTLITDQKKSPDQESTPDKSSCKKLTQAPAEPPEGFNIPNLVQTDQSLEIPIQGPPDHKQDPSSSSNKQDPSSSSSSSSNSSDTSFCEDSDDSVKDPMYIPPEPTLQHNLEKMSGDEIDELVCYNDENIAPSSAENVSILPTTSRENNMNTTVSPTSPPAKVGRKRKRNEKNWKRNVTKQLRNTGQAYESASKKIKEKREMKGPCGDKCRLKCSANLTEEERKSLFHDYWALGDNKKQWDYISRSMTVLTPKYRYVREGGTRKPRQKNNAFYFKLPNKQVRVCKMFLSKV